MSTAVATRSRTEIAQESAYDPFAAAGNDLGGSAAVYAKFNGNSGEFAYGAQATEIEEGEKFVADVSGARRGWICWKEEAVIEEIMVPIIQGPPPRKDELPDHGPYEKHEDGTEDGWSEQFAISFRLLGEDHDGIEVLYKTSTKSAFRPLGDLLKDYGRQYKNYPGCLPIIEFGKGSYMPKEKKHGKKYFPTFKIIDWIDEDELIAQYGDGRRVKEDDENDNIVKEEPKKVTKAKAEPKEEAKAETPAEEKAAPAEDVNAARMRELEAQLAALKAGGSASAETTKEVEKPAPETRQARRRSF